MPFRITCRVCGRVVTSARIQARYCSQPCAAVGRSAVPREVPAPECSTTPQGRPEPPEPRPCDRYETLFSAVNFRRLSRCYSVTYGAAALSVDLAPHV